MFMSGPTPRDHLLRFDRRRDYLPWLAVGMVFVAALVILEFQGREWWCPAGDASLWSWEVWSRHSSQHLVDAYSFTHILHGLLEFWLIGLLFWKLPMAWRLVIALSIEGTWEVVENTNYVINRYREATISLDYFGDSIVNSLADIACCGIGFTIAYRLRFLWSLALFTATEALLLLTIRDSLLVNIIMLIYPIEAIKQWQAAGM
jgi:hypothetical protein